MYLHDLHSYIEGQLPYLDFLLGWETLDDVRRILNRLTGLNVRTYDLLDESEWRFIEALEKMRDDPGLKERIDAVFAVHRAVEVANRPT